MRRVALVLVILSINLLAVTIKKIEFRGLIHISDRLAKEYVGFEEGSRLDINKVDKSIKKFFEQGYFDDILVEMEDDGTLVYIFKEKPTIASIEIDGVDEEKVDEVKAILGFKKGDSYDKQKVEKGATNVIKYYESQGYYDSVAEAEIEKINDQVVKIKMVINKGENIIIDKTVFFTVNSKEKMTVMGFY